MVVIREPTGVLRTANSEERDRILQVYFPQPGRMYQVPELFGAETLEVCLTHRPFGDGVVILETYRQVSNIRRPKS